jgi:hypothetical protein
MWLQQGIDGAASPSFNRDKIRGKGNNPFTLWMENGYPEEEKPKDHIC